MALVRLLSASMKVRHYKSHCNIIKLVIGAKKRRAVSIKAITGVADSDDVEENVDDGDVDD